MSNLESRLSTYDAESVTFRGEDLTEDLMGELDFGGTVLLMLTGERPTPGESRLINAILDSLMVHGVTPNAIAARMTYLSEPTSIQGAVASGLLGVGARFVGSMQECSAVLGEIDTAEDTETAVTDAVATYREAGDPFPGIGHPFHKPVDPRTQRLFEIAVEEGLAGSHIDHIRAVQSEFETVTGKRLVINLTGAIAATSADMGLPPVAARGLAVISRAAGLVAEVIEEKNDPIARDVWNMVEEEMTYIGPDGE
jgi:citrate synthase